MTTEEKAQAFAESALPMDKAHMLDTYDNFTIQKAQEKIAEGFLAGVLYGTPKWISCSERQPKEPGDYLILEAARYLRIARFTGVPGKYFWDLDDYGLHESQVTHWMPTLALPEDPENKS